jgi:hypothetical protein
MNLAEISSTDISGPCEHGHHGSTADVKDTQTHVYNDLLREFKKVSIDRLMDEEILNEHSIQEALTNVNTRKYMLILLDGIVYDDDEDLKPLARKIFLDWNILDKIPLIDCLNDKKNAYYTLDLLNDLMFSDDKELFVLSAKIMKDEKIFSKDFIKRCLNDKKTEKIMLDIMSNFAYLDYVE